MVAVSVSYKYSLKVFQLQSELLYSFDYAIAVFFVRLHAIQQNKSVRALKNKAPYHRVSYVGELVKEAGGRYAAYFLTEVRFVRVGPAPCFVCHHFYLSLEITVESVL